MQNLSNLIRLAISSILIGVSLVTLILMFFMKAIRGNLNEFRTPFLLVIIITLSIGSFLLYQSVKKWRINNLASLELKLINLAKRQDGMITIPDASVKLNKSIESVASGFKSLERKDIIEVSANDKGGLEYRLLF